MAEELGEARNGSEQGIADEIELELAVIHHPAAAHDELSGPWTTSSMGRAV
jgi:hypothetical protein